MAGKVLLLAALSGASYLTWAGWSPNVVGCGSASGCEVVLTSRWAKLLGLPVSLLALPVYLALLISPSRLQKGGMTLVAVTWLAAAWFTLLQVIVIKDFCWICLATHLSASLGALAWWQGAKAGTPAGGSKKPWLWAAALVAGLALVQTVQRHQTHFVQFLKQNGATLSAGGREIQIHRVRYALSDLPVSGSAEATHAVVLLFDYTCPHCRVTHGRLAEVQRAFGNRLAIVSLPVPLDRECNRNLEMTTAMHKDACAYARLGMAVSRLGAPQFEQFNRWMFEPATPPPLERAREFARQLEGGVGLEAILASDWPAQQINRGLAIFTANYMAKQQDELPHLIVGAAISFGEIADTTALFRLVEEQLRLKPDRGRE